MNVANRIKRLESDILPRGEMLQFLALPKEERLEITNRIAKEMETWTDEELEGVLSGCSPQLRKVLSELSDKDLENYCIHEISAISNEGQRKLQSVRAL